MANTDAWHALRADVRASVDCNLTTFALLARRDTALRNASLSEKLARRGMAVNAAQTAGLCAKLSESGFYAHWNNVFGPEAWSLLKAHSAKLSQRFANENRRSCRRSATRTRSSQCAGAM